MLFLFFLQFSSDCPYIGKWPATVRLRNLPPFFSCSLAVFTIKNKNQPKIQNWPFYPIITPAPQIDSDDDDDDDKTKWVRM